VRVEKEKFGALLWKLLDSQAHDNRLVKIFHRASPVLSVTGLSRREVQTDAARKTDALYGTPRTRPNSWLMCPILRCSNNGVICSVAPHAERLCGWRRALSMPPEA